MAVALKTVVRRAWRAISGFCRRGPHAASGRETGDCRSEGAGRRSRPTRFTGDAGAATRARLARDLAVDDFRETGLTPDAKRVRGAWLLAKTRRVEMVGMIRPMTRRHGVRWRSTWRWSRDRRQQILVRRHVAWSNDLPTFSSTPCVAGARRTHAIILQNAAGHAGDRRRSRALPLPHVGVVTPIMAAAIHLTAALAVHPERSPPNSVDGRFTGPAISYRACQLIAAARRISTAGHVRHFMLMQT